ncbi:transglutaminase family protein, partial [Zavarzinella formosa]|uniref:transglutaminase family protein n=1 Tax=Zavarzinella formosa TaxID=360055 RepID=UPI00187DCBCB
MLPINPFRNSLYVSLTLAILCVGVAGYDLLPEFPFITVFSLLLLGAAYVMEGRFELNLRDANLVGLFLSVTLGLWGLFQFVRPPTGLTDMLPWPASALPYLAPVVLVLIPAKLFRPKHTGDYWTMHGLGLVSVSLACAMASDGVFVVFFIGYAISFVWGLAMFQIYREVGSELSLRVSVVRSRGRELWPAIVRAALVGLLAVPLFWMTPRSGQNWQLGFNNRMKSTGLGEGAVDMNSSGPLEVNREKVFEVKAENRQGEPILDLPGDLRWRVAHLQNYNQGRWQRDTNMRFQLVERVKAPEFVTNNPYQRLPDFGPETIYLTFMTGSKMGRNQPLADPIAWRGGEFSPVVSRPQREASSQSWNQRPDGSFDGLSVTRQYLQAWVAPEDFNHTPVMRIIGPPNGLAQVPVALWRLKEYAEKLLRTLVEKGKIPAEALKNRDPVSNELDPKYHEIVSREISDHFAHSGEFRYTLDLVRLDKTIDPVEDFILNVKAGHCQRFASALALVLRAIGVPAQLVLGYRGLESREDGWYDIREDHAHAWVEALVPASDAGLPLPERLPPGLLPRDIQAYRWSILDPTPSGVEAITTGPVSFLDRAKERWETVVKALLLAYNADSREQSARAVREWLVNDHGWLTLLGIFGGGYVLRKVWRRWRVRREGTR